MEALFGVHGTTLAVRSARLERLASNIANAATPGYRATDIDFDAAMALADGGADAGAALARASGYRQPLQPSLDGNTVELPVEQALFAENAVRYRTALTFLEGRVNTVMRALKGE